MRTNEQGFVQEAVDDAQRSVGAIGLDSTKLSLCVSDRRRAGVQRACRCTLCRVYFRETQQTNVLESLTRCNCTHNMTVLC